jgi:Flp pilus assembly protein TadD
MAAEEQGKWADAEAHFRKALRLEPEQAQWHVELGCVLKRQRQDWEEAGTHFRRAVELTVNDPEALTELGRFLAEQPGKIGEALTILERAEGAAPYDGQVRVALGWAYFISGRYDVAERYLSSATEVVPDLAEAQERLGDFYIERGRPATASGAWKKALSLSTRPEDKVRLRAKLDAEMKSRH